MSQVTKLRSSMVHGERKRGGGGGALCDRLQLYSLGKRQKMYLRFNSILWHEIKLKLERQVAIYIQVLIRVDSLAVVLSEEPSWSKLIHLGVLIDTHSRCTLSEEAD